ncbi:HAMP domain-containing protein [Candidatus Poribacteria bacterium]|nr:HAMP domain-containing protein [Candidatus Poribacteria bacterium]
MRNRLSGLRFHDKIFIAYGFVFLVMFGVVFGSTSFLIRLAFKREIDSYVERVQAQISNSYRKLLNKVQKEVHATATDVRLHRVIESESRFPYLPAPEFDLLEYGTADGRLLYPDTRVGQRTRTYNSLDDEEGYIQLRIIPLQSDLGLQYVVQVTEAGEWGFVTGGYLLQKWLETTQTSLQSDEHPIFLVGKTQSSETTSFDTELETTAAEDWLPLNYASQTAQGRGWFKSLPRWLPEQKIFLQGTEETGGRAFTAFRITPFNSPFATTRATPAVGLIVAYSHERQMKWQQQLTITLLLSGIGGLALVYLISYIISRRITRPIAVLREGVSHIAAGDLDHRVKIQSRNEVGQLAEGFNQMAQDLKQSMEERMAAERAATWRDAARQVAHEVKNPLFPIRLSVENLQQAKSNPEVFEQIFSECTDTVIEEVDRIGKLIDEFHQFARMPKPQRKWSQLNDIVRSVLTLYTGRHITDLAQENEGTPMSSEQVDSVLQDSTEKFWLENISKIKVRTELDPLPRLLVDPEQMTQALGNLLKNAIEAMPAGGLLKVKTYFTPKGSQSSVSVDSLSEYVLTGEDDNDRHTPSSRQRENLTADENDSDSRAPKAINGTVSLEIQDTGHGMSEETMANLFVPYYTTKSEANGRGLGVPIVRRIVTEHGADIDFQSAEGEGTTVRIHFSHNQETRSEAFTSATQEFIPRTSLVTELETEDPTVGVKD